MIEGIAQALLDLAALLVEVAIWAGVGLHGAIRAIVLPVHREKIRREWHRGWRGKVSLLFSGVFWTSLIVPPTYLWFAVRPAAA